MTDESTSTHTSVSVTLQTGQSSRRTVMTKWYVLCELQEELKVKSTFCENKRRENVESKHDTRR